MGLDPSFVDQPLQHLARTIRRVAGQPLRVELEALVCPFDHGLGCLDLRLTDGRRSFHLDDDGVIEIDQVVGRVGEEGLPTVGAGPARRRISRRDEFTSVAAPNAASSSIAMYSSTARLDTSGDKPSDP